MPATVLNVVLTNSGRQPQAEDERSVPPIRQLWVTVPIYSSIDAPQDALDGDFPSEHPYATTALAVTLIGVGTAVFLPAVTIGMLGIIGLGPGGVAAGQHFPQEIPS